MFIFISAIVVFLSPKTFQHSNGRNIFRLVIRLHQIVFRVRLIALLRYLKALLLLSREHHTPSA